ncbi:hypothetical protein [Butyrivibrio sp. NC3005]|uniref:hypothetical protein n=1 Tax=Butyrivibrio sp. NC3005 TaxID=1280685 RepID=UPI0004280495|nr:hypothetical protein [Butyrivibrio sp. NC3005]
MDRVTRKTDRVFLIIYLFGFILAALILARVQPLYPKRPLLPNPPDEFTRYVVPDYICKTGKLPTGFEPEVQIAGYGGSYAFLPILPYIVMGYVMRLFSLFGSSDVTLVFVARLVNVISGVIMAFIVFLLSKRLFRNRFFSYLFCTIVMFWPEHIFLHTYVNTESFSELSIAIILFAILKIYQDGIDDRSAILLSVGYIICLLTYYNAYGYILVSGILLILHLISLDKKSALRFFSIVFIVTLMGASWWFIRNLINLDGDLLGLSTLKRVRMELGVSMPLTYMESGKSIIDMFTETDLAPRMLKTFICCYGAASIDAGPIMYLFYKIFLFVGFITAIFFAPKVLKKASFSQKLFHAGMVVSMLIVFCLWLVYSYALDFQPQGRYLIAMIIPLFYYFLAGFEKLWQVLKKKLQICDRWLGVASVFIMCIVVFLEYNFVFKTMLPICLE